MSEETECRKWRRGQVVSMALLSLIPAAVLTGCRSSWIEPLPGIRVEPTRPIVKESDLGPESAYQLLMAAVAEPPGLKLPEGTEATRAWDWSEALDKLHTQPWPEELPPPAAPAAPAPEWVGFDADGMSRDADAPWTRAQVLDIQRVLELYRPRFAMLDRALAAPDPQMPTMMPDDLDSMAYMPPSRELSQALVLSAHCQAAAGDIAGAYRDLLRGAHLGNLVARGGPLINGLISGTLLGNSCAAARHISLRYGGSPDVLRRAAKGYLACADAMEPVPEIMRAEALFAREGILRSYSSVLADGLADPAKRWQPGSRAGWALIRFGWLVGSTPKRTAGSFDALSQHMVALAEQPYSAAIAASLGDLSQRLDARGSMVKVLLDTWDPVGCLVACDTLDVWEHFPGKFARSRAQMRGTALFLAIRAYETEHGTLPEQLAQLVPDYLPRVPTDPFDGKPFRYLRSNVSGLPPEAWAVYSIGEDFIDDGGTAKAAGTVRNDRGVEPDLVWPSLDYPPLPPPKESEGMFGEWDEQPEMETGR